MEPVIKNKTDLENQEEEEEELGLKILHEQGALFIVAVEATLYRSLPRRLPSTQPTDHPASTSPFSFFLSLRWRTS